MKLLPLSFILVTFFSNAEEINKLTDVFKTPEGSYQGMVEDGYFQFKGIPYAEPPIGERRWQPPKDKNAMSGTFFAGKFGNSCATIVRLAGFGKISQSEDCLYLNIYTPKTRPGEKKSYPVLFWIPGGGLRTGSGDEYDVSNFIKRDIVVVTVNYRLGVFGFFSHPSLNSHNEKINYGLLDQQKALQWVKKNISEFGGNPENITIFGESAGGQSVIANIISPLSKGLFNKAIISSGSYKFDQNSVQEANRIGLSVSKIVGCNDGGIKEQLSCLKKTPTEKLLTTDISNFYNDQFTIDGHILPLSFSDAIANGNFNKIDIINGFQNNEGTFFSGVIENESGHKIDKKTYIKAMRTLYGKDFSSDSENEKNTDFTLKLSQDLTKHKFICPSIEFNKLISKEISVYSYIFNDITAPQYIPKMSIPYQASHTSELAYIFKGFHGATGQETKLNHRQSKLSETILSYLSNFIKSGDPNKGENIPLIWSRSAKENDATIVFSDKGISKENNVSILYGCDRKN